jgi:hypothetical protein
LIILNGTYVQYSFFERLPKDIFQCSKFNVPIPLEHFASANIEDRQYQRIARSCDHITEFIKQEKTPGGVFSKTSRGFRFGRNQVVRHTEEIRLGAGLVLLEDYAKTFTRDMPQHYRMNIRNRQRRYELLSAHCFSSSGTLFHDS